MIDARTQMKSIDFSGATSTRPVQTGGSLPANCAVGQMFFQTSAPAGANLYGCTAPNTWSLQSSQGTAGASMAAQLGDLGVVAASSTTLAINSNCTPATPCTVLAAGGTIYSFTAAATAAISGTAGAGTATIYVSDQGVLTLEYPSGISGLGVACAGCTAIALATPGIPPDAIPVAQVAFSTSGAVTSWGSITDRRAFLSAVGGSLAPPSLSAGPAGGVLVSCSSGNCQASLDTAFAAIQAGNNNFTGNNSLGMGAAGDLDKTCTNGSTGTADKLLAKLSGATCIRTAAAADIPAGIVIPGTGGASGSARVASAGYAACTFDNTPSVGDYVVGSSTGACHGAGSSRPPGGTPVVGTVWAPVSGSDYTVNISLDPNQSGGGSSSFGTSAVFEPIPLNTVNAGAQTRTFAPHQIHVWKFSIPASLTINSITSVVASGVGSGDYLGFAVYDSACASLLTSSAASGGAISAAFSVAVPGYTLPAGTYYMAVTDTGTSLRSYVTAATSGIMGMIVTNNGATAAYAIAGNLTSGTSVITWPNSCGALTPANDESLPWPVRLSN